MTIKSPQLILSLSPEDNLVVELPGAFATRRRIELLGGAESAFAQLKRILAAQREDRTEIGTDGAPTERQLRHWEQHLGAWPQGPDSRCPFCWSEGLLKEPGEGRAARHSRKTVVYKTTEGVEVRRIEARKSGLGPQVSKARKDAEDLGL